MATSSELRSGSIAAIVLGSPDDVLARPRAARGGVEPPVDSLAWIVLGPAGAAPARLLGTTLLGVVALYVGIAVAAARWSPSRSLSAPAKSAAPLRLEHVVELAPPTPPPQEAPRVESPRQPPASPVRHSAAATRAPAPRPPAPAAAGQVIAAEPRAAELDFTGDSIVTGAGTEYAGGITASSSSNTSAVESGDVDRGGPSGAGSGARPVGLPRSDWSCPWPREAEALSIDEEAVLLRVVVRPDGSVADADLISDPGHGFGAVALECARGQRFPPARGDDGNPITAMSPPIRVRFTRSPR